MSSIIPALPTLLTPAAAPIKAAVRPPADVPPRVKPVEAKTAEKKTADTSPRPAEHHPVSALSAADVSYVDSLLGVAPAQVMEYILLKTGVPQPANLGQDVDMTA